MLHSSDEIQARKEGDRNGNTLCSSFYHSFISFRCDLRDHKRNNKELEKITAQLFQSDAVILIVK